MPNPIVEVADAVGGQNKLARLLGVTPATVSEWRHGRRPVPIRHCAALVQHGGGRVTRQQLRPDDFAVIWPELADQPSANQAREAA